DHNTVMMQDLLGTEIFNADEEPLELQRNFTSYEFNTRSLCDFIVETVDGETTHRLLPLLTKSAAGMTQLDIHDDVLPDSMTA
ncbi:hypothetical protein KI387_017340, partial [Taxus chinensis]